MSLPMDELTEEMRLGDEAEPQLENRQTLSNQSDAQVADLTSRVKQLGRNVRGACEEPGECAVAEVRELQWQRFKDLGRMTQQSEAPPFQEHQTRPSLSFSMPKSCWPPHIRRCETKVAEGCTSDIGSTDYELLTTRNVDILGESKHCDPLMEYMKLTASPEVPSFHEKEKENFNRFVNAFSVRYPSSIWDGRSRVQLFEGFLRKDALTMFETLPKAVKDAPFEVVVEAMKQRLKVDSNGSCVKAMTQLAALAIREGQSVAEFCLVLEKLASRAYPDTPPEVVSLQKAEILFRQLASWEGSYCIVEAIETSSKGEVYEKVKEVALRLEKDRKMASNMSQPLRQIARLPHIKHKVVERSPRIFEPSRLRHQTAEAEDAGTSKADRTGKALELKQQSIGNRRAAEEQASIQCYKCGKRGHKAKECRGTSSSYAPNKPQGRQTGSFSAFLDSLLCSNSVSNVADTSKELFGQKSVVMVEIMGMQVEALLDTQAYP